MEIKLLTFFCIILFFMLIYNIQKKMNLTLQMIFKKCMTFYSLEIRRNSKPVFEILYRELFAVIFVGSLQGKTGKKWSRQGPCREEISRPGKKCRGPDRENDSRSGKKR